MKNKQDKKQHLRKLEIVEREVERTLKRCGVYLTLEDLKKMVFEEKGHEEWTQDLIKFIGGNKDSYEEILMMFNDAWNYFPHKTMGGLSPADKMREYEESDERAKTPEKVSGKNKKLTPKQMDLLWSGSDDGGPYSQVKLVKEVRILGDMVSRTFLTVDIEINPTTFEIIERHRHDKEFERDIEIQQLLDHSSYRGPQFGYVVAAFIKEYEDENVLMEAELALLRAQKTAIKMHKFVMENYLRDKN